MTEVLGPQSLLDLALPTGVDATKLAEFALQDGVSYGEMVNTLALAMGGFNQDLVDRWGWCMSFTRDIMMEYPDGGSVTQLPEITEQQKPEALKGTTIGHMIDFKSYGQGIGGSWMYWRDARAVKVQAAIVNLLNRGRWRFEKDLLDRWFTNTENSVGSSGYDVPFVRGTGGSVDFTPPAYSGQSFTTSHDHYIGIDSGSYDQDDVLNQMAEHLEEHGHEPPFTALISRSDLANYRALVNFIEFAPSTVQFVDQGGSTGNRYTALGSRPMCYLGKYLSDYGEIDILYSARIPTTYAGMMKSYGTQSTQNGLKVRLHRTAPGFGAYIVPQTVPDNEFPISQVDVVFEFGIGVGEDRTNGVASYLVAGGTWANPTIT